MLDLFEELYIKTHNILAKMDIIYKQEDFTKHSKETCKKRSESLKKLLKDPEKRKIWSEAKLVKSKNLKENVKKL